MKVPVLCMLTAGVTTAAQNGATNEAPAEAQRPNIMGKLTTAKKTIAVFGQPIVYYEAGRGRTLVLLAQLGWDSHMWSQNMPALAENYHVIAMDLLGTGDSARRSRENSIGHSPAFLRDGMLQISKLCECARFPYPKATIRSALERTITHTR